MILVADLGNSRIKWGVCEQGTLQDCGGLSYGSGTLRRDLNFAWAAIEEPKLLMYCAVAPESLVAEFEDCVTSRWKREPERLKATRAAHGVRCAYRNPGQLGADRWAALVAARHMAPEGAVVVDCGTTITVDAVDHTGQHLGGVILPGLWLMRRSLAEGTGRIGRVDDGVIDMMTRDTSGAVATGTVIGAAAGVDRAVNEYLARLGPDARCLITGGEADIVMSRSRTAFQVWPDLVLRGLWIAAERMP